MSLIHFSPLILYILAYIIVQYKHSVLHMQAVDTHYSFAKRDATLRIVFEESEISLDIGQVTGEGWKVIPQSHPSVSYRILHTLANRLQNVFNMD